MRASALDLIVAMAIFIASAIVVLFVFYIWQQLSSSPIIPSNIAKSGTTAFSYIADALVFLYFAAVFAAVIFAYFTPSHPVFAIMFIIIEIVAILVADVFSDIWQEIISNSIFVNLGNTYFFYVTLVFKYLPFLSLGLGILLMIVMYSKPVSPLLAP